MLEPSNCENASPQANRDAEFLALLGRHESKLITSVHLMVPKWHEAEEVLQETRLVLWRKFGEFQPGSNFLAWARATARLIAHAHFRNKQVATRMFSEEMVDSLLAHVAENPVEESRRWAALRECSQKLSSAAWELLRLVYGEKKKVREAAEQAGRSVNGTYVMLSKVRRQLAVCVSLRLQEEEA
jgi:RNA polymerase sigma-70 factor (ECF subfamily)